MQIHLDPLGGIAGDMFVAALLDAFPDHWPRVEASIASLGLGAAAACRLLSHSDGTLTGKRFRVGAEAGEHDEGHHGHAHRTWASIRALIEGAPLAAATKQHAIAIFALLASAEAQVHGIAEADVAFHEIGAVDSIVDIVAAGEVIALLEAGTWSTASLPQGSGRVRTAHGYLPVPAPATALLLAGFPMIDDGIPGERVTPTGAAILRHLVRPKTSPSAPRTLLKSGFGFGTKRLPGISNGLRVLVFEEASAAARAASFLDRDMAVIAFEVDDQTPEDLAIGLDLLRAAPGVLDVVQFSVVGKKGRLATHVQVLAVPAELDGIIEACFAETTTIGLRIHLCRGLMLPRITEEVEFEGRGLRVKIVERGRAGRTAKAEVADVGNEAVSAERQRLRRAAEALALKRPSHDV